MAGPSRRARSARPLAALAVLIALVFAVIGANATWNQKSWTPQLGLDLEGGTQIVLQPIVSGGGSINAETLRQSVDIIRARIDGSGVGEAEVTTEGGRNVVVSVPGKINDRQRNLIKQSSQLRFRPVLVAAPTATAPTPSGTSSPTPSGTATGSATPSATPSSTGEATVTLTPSASAGSRATATPSGSSAQRGLPQALMASTTSPSASPTSSAAPSANPSASPELTASTSASGPATSAPQPTASGAPTPTDASDPTQITPALQRAFTQLDCTDTSALQGGTDDPNKPLVTCDSTDPVKYLLGPVEVAGTDIADATAGLQSTQNGGTSNTWVVNLTFTGEGSRKFREVTTRLTGLESPRNQFAVVLDGLVITAPQSLAVITNGQAEISGSFTQASSLALANQLKYGALPISFDVQTEEQISPLLGAEQLQRGLLAGVIGLLLVIVYSFIQYRALALVSVASLAVAGVLTYGTIVLLGQLQGFRLSLAGVTGVIVSIGITADSFIVYFERVRDEVREGRSLRAAVETGWKRAQRTILAADGINFLAAVVLYVLAAGSVRGFAYTLGLTTIIDIVVVFLFTHPMLTRLARTRFFGEGHRFSGLDRDRLGSGTIRPGLKANLGTIASRRAAAAGATQKGA